MRTHDLTPPAVTGDRPGPDVPMGQWPAQLYVAIERVNIDAYAWDDGTTTWDGGAVWDYPAAIDGEYVDALCWLHGLTCTTGSTDAEGRYDAGELAMTLDNRDGRWSQHDSFGRLVNYLPGRDVLVWAELDGEPWWLWAGQITSWREQTDGTVEVEAFDVFSRLNQQAGSWDPGVDGDTVAARLDAILDLFGYTGPRRFDTGDVTLAGPTTTRTPLEELQQSAISDGGILGVDADGTLIYRDRRWPNGRDDQDAIPVLSDNICTGDAVVWDLILATDDEMMANIVDLTNTGGVTVHAENPDSRSLHGPLTLPNPRDKDLWQTEGQGQALADYIVTRRGDAYTRLDGATLYLHDPQQPQLWRIGVDRRLGDLLELVHSQPAADGEQIIDVFYAVQSITHEITPGGWVQTVTTSRAVGNRVAYRWDASPFTWDDPDTRNLWGY